MAPQGHPYPITKDLLSEFREDKPCARNFRGLPDFDLARRRLLLVKDENCSILGTSIRLGDTYYERNRILYKGLVGLDFEGVKRALMNVDRACFDAIQRTCQ